MLFVILAPQPLHFGFLLVIPAFAAYLPLRRLHDGAEVKDGSRARGTAVLPGTMQALPGAAGVAGQQSQCTQMCPQQDTSTRSQQCHHRAAGDSHMVQGVLPKCSVGERGFPTWALLLHADRRGLFLFSLCSNSPIFLTVAVPFTAG